MPQNEAPIGPQKSRPRAIKNGVAEPHHSSTARSTTDAIGEAQPFRSQLSSQQREQATALLSQPNPPSDAEVARRIGCSYGAIKHLKLRIEQGSDTASRVLSIYGRRFVRELPPKERVSLYAAIARGEIDAKRAFSSLKSLQRVEELEGIVTKKEQKESEPAPSVTPPGPVFVIAGAHVSVQTPQQVVVSPSKLIESTEVIDVSAIESTREE